LAKCLADQSLAPAAWIVVDDGSSDKTAAVIQTFAREHRWAAVIASPGALLREGPLGAGRQSGRDVLAFNAGIAALTKDVDIVVKLDADVSMAPSYFEHLMHEFRRDPCLGIAGGKCFELHQGAWKAQNVTGNHVRGATRAYRRECLAQLEPLEQRLGWDVIDELGAQLLGWRTRSIETLPFFHHRPMGSRDGAWRAWWSQGETAHYLGYRPSYLVIRAFHRSKTNPTALAMLGGWAAAGLRRRPRYSDKRVRDHLRRQQTLRNLRRRAQEALGQLTE